MEKRELLYEGKAKRVYATADPGLVIQYFKDDATAFNAQKRGTIANKGVYNNAISAALFRYLEGHGVPTHFVRTLSEREMLVRRLEIVPVEVVVRNVIAGSLAKRLGLEEGKDLPRPILEHYYKNDALGDPLINPWHITVLGFAGEAELETINNLALEVNRLLRALLQPRGLLLVDFKLEFGRHQGSILLGDEISPDTCRFWDVATREKLDKDRFRFDLGDVEHAYAEVHRRICGTA
ncbi:MAG: phosphoribosylaminoimidazolesuccinocarboxamide synthase [candidate division KSB1 bacterium]|nr:phosphoribosylaminoimidazolesuccinocarboxamide synthase [candidate division KSB1 bacterium]